MFDVSKAGVQFSNEFPSIPETTFLSRIPAPRPTAKLPAPAALNGDLLEESNEFSPRSLNDVKVQATEATLSQLQGDMDQLGQAALQV